MCLRHGVLSSPFLDQNIRIWLESAHAVNVLFSDVEAELVVERPEKAKPSFMEVESSPVDRHVDVILRVAGQERHEYLSTVAERLTVELERQIVADTESFQSTIVLPVDRVVEDRYATADATQFLDAVLNDEQLFKVTLECLLRTLLLTSMVFHFDWSQLVVDPNLKSASLQREQINGSKRSHRDLAVRVVP